MTTLETPASLYPAAAIPVLLITIGAAIGVNRVMAYLESPRPFSDESKAARALEAMGLSWILSRITQGLTTVQETPADAPELEILVTKPPSPGPPLTPSGPNPSMTGPQIEVSPDTEENIFAPAKRSLGLNPSSMALSYRVSGVARVDSRRLRPGDAAGASPGAMRSPSGTLRHH